MSNESTHIKNTFEKGMWLDSYNSYQPEGTYRYALNAVSETDEYTSSFGTFIANEQEPKEILELPARVVGQGIVESRNWSVVFLENNEIGYIDLDKKEYTSIYKGSCFNFDKCEEINPKFAFRTNCGELITYFSSNCDYYRVNLDELLRGIPYCDNCEDKEECCDHFRIMKGVSIPNITTEKYEGGGSGAESGSYSFTCRYVDAGGNFSNWFVPSKPNYLIGENGQPGEPSKNSLHVTFEGLDENYTTLEIAMIKTVGGVTTWHSLGERAYNTKGITIQYSGQAPVSDITPNEIFVPRKKYIRGRALHIDNGRLYLYKIKQEKEVNVFKYSSQARVHAVAYSVPQEESHKYMSMEGGEVYRLGLVLNYVDGTHSPVGQIPATGLGNISGGLSELYSEEEVEEAIENTSRARLEPDYDEDPGDKYNPGEGEPIRESPRNGGGEDVGGDQRNPPRGAKNYRRRSPRTTSTTPSARREGRAPEPAPNPNRVTKEMLRKAEECECGPEVEKIIGFLGDPISGVRVELNKIVEDCPCIGVTDGWENVFDGLEPDTSGIDPDVGDDRPRTPRQINVSSKTPSKSLSTNPLEPITEIMRVPTTPKESSLLYPATRDCNGDFVYGKFACNPILDHRMPSRSDIPIVFSAADGVVSRYSLENKEKGDTNVIVLGIAVTDIVLPPEEELPKPLNKENPYSIVYVKRDETNKSIIAKGLATGVFEGDIHGKPYLFPRHGINGSELIDRSISSGGNQSRLGTRHSDEGFVFHSPTTDILGPALNATHVKVENNVSGSGYRLGLYAETTTHSAGIFKPIVDNRGYRSAINLNKFDYADSVHEIKGITYAPGDSIVTPVGGLNKPLCNRYRERSVFVAASIDTPVDASFQGDTIDHYCPIENVHAQYVSLVREIPDQYGGVESSSYIPLLMNGKGSEISGPCGDVYISFYTKRRTSYISDKNGKDLSPDRGLWDTIRKSIGAEDQWELPKDQVSEGDPKAIAGTQGSARCSPGEIRNAQTDTYLPSVAKHNIMFWTESPIHCDWRMKGNEDLGEVWYGNLGSLEYDSDTPEQQDWENCWMNRFYAEHVRPSTFQRLARVAILVYAIFWIVHFFFTGAGAGISSLIDAVLFGVRLAAVIVMATVVLPHLFRKGIVNKILGIREWYDDDSEGYVDEYVKGWEDIYGEYNLDYSNIDNGKVFFPLDKYFNDCDCSNCLVGETTNEVYYSNRQIQGSRIDNFYNFNANSFLSISPAHGKLQKLFSVRGGLYAHTTDTILAIQEQQGQIDPVMGGGLRLHPISLTPGVPEGNWGTRDPNASITTKWGYFFIDNDHGSIHLFNGEAPIEISAIGLKNFWKEFTGFCEEGCRDAKLEGVFYNLGIDHRKNRLLVTKNNKNNEDLSFTISFDLNNNVWRSYHSYIPNRYIWNRSKLFHLENDKLFIHNDNPNKFLPMELEFNATHPSYFEYKDTKLDTEANLSLEGRSWIYDQKVTFNKAIIFNRTQCTGLINLKIVGTNLMDDYNIQDPSQIILSKVGDEWRFNQVSDYVIDPTQPIFKGKECSPFLYLNEDNIDQNKAYTEGDFQNEIYSGKNIAYRFRLDSEEGMTHQFYVRQILTNIGFPIQ